MKTRNTKLVLKKSAILELQNKELTAIYGGSGIMGGQDCTGCGDVGIPNTFGGTPFKTDPVIIGGNNNVNQNM